MGYHPHSTSQNPSGLRFKGELNQNGIHGHELGSVRLLWLQIAQVEEGHGAVKIDTSSLNPSIHFGLVKSPSSISLKQSIGNRETRLVKSTLSGVPIERPFPKVWFRSN